MVGCVICWLAALPCGAWFCLMTWSIFVEEQESIMGWISWTGAGIMTAVLGTGGFICIYLANQNRLLKSLVRRTPIPGSGS